MSSTRSAGVIGSVSRKRAQIERTLVSYSSANWVHWSPSSPSQAFAISTLAIGSVIRPSLGHGPNVRVRAHLGEPRKPILIKSSSAPLGGTSSSSCGPRARTKEVAVQILIVNFNLDGLSEEEFASSRDELAPAFAAVPGLASKVWLADRAEGIFGGVYTFESEKAVDDYLQSDLFAGVGSTPGLVNISVRRFGVLDGPTRVTRGLAQPAGV